MAGLLFDGVTQAGHILELLEPKVRPEGQEHRRQEVISISARNPNTIPGVGWVGLRIANVQAIPGHRRLLKRGVVSPDARRVDTTLVYGVVF